MKFAVKFNRPRPLSLLAVLLLAASAGCQKPNPLIGTWKGTLKLSGPPQIPAGAGSLRLEMKFDKGSDGVTGTLKSPDQGNVNLVLDTVEVKDRDVKLAVNGLQASYSGKLNADGTAMTGKWSQGPLSFPLTLTKEK